MEKISIFRDGYTCIYLFVLLPIKWFHIKFELVGSRINPSSHGSLYLSWFTSCYCIQEKISIRWVLTCGTHQNLLMQMMIRLWSKLSSLECIMGKIHNRLIDETQCNTNTHTSWSHNRKIKNYFVMVIRIILESQIYQSKIHG